ncbi:HDOD domain-containing protein [Glaciecola petra]|uniref:HDOD domain-containing protein n=1 Tax=Glaciecola petra TaxID=3075602 RepID=A0ABU2ZPK1_9ALTE|nr:HDOD domain-containing protein [Aestuariibacter sp. P117]MDT0593524.1 HDOD domain-containing protein [Aestuariibacter sp. P117]
MSINPLIKHASKNFTLPDTCIRLRHILDDPKSSLDDIAKVMSVDPNLSAKVLKLANSALFRFPSQVSSISKALSVIGGEAAYNISMAQTANLAFKSVNGACLNFKSFWEKSVCTGIIAKSLYQQIQKRGSERYFVMGIMLNLSELVVADHLDTKYRTYLSNKVNRLPLETQRESLGFCFSHCSGRVLEAWNLPESIYAPMANLSLYPNQQFGLDESILYAAATMADLQLGKELLTRTDVNMQAFQSIGLEGHEYDIILQFAQTEAGKIAQAIG